MKRIDDKNPPPGFEMETENVPGTPKENAFMKTGAGDAMKDTRPESNFHSFAWDQWIGNGAAVKTIDFLGRDNLVKIVEFLNERGAIMLIDTWKDGVFSVTISENHIDAVKTFLEKLEGAQ